VDTASDGAGMPVAPRPAATVVVVRAGQEGIETLLGQRSAVNRFAPGFVVFPGGVVEDGDRELARRWFGSPSDVARACAVRELREETGLVLSSGGLVGSSDGGSRGGPLDAAALPEIAHWVAPDFLPVRFDARFFCAEAASDADPAPDGIEIERAWGLLRPRCSRRSGPATPP
jgi:8-oxo-dGTP pyrophosphatase MutT (NUDIX family)